MREKPYEHTEEERAELIALVGEEGYRKIHENYLKLFEEGVDPAQERMTMDVGWVDEEDVEQK